MNVLKYILGVLGAVIGAFIGGYDGLVYVLIVFMIFDYITGVLVAIKTKTLNSNTGFWGLVKKMIIFSIVGIANMLDIHVFEFNLVIRTVVIISFICNEGLSLLENTTMLGVNVPNKLKDVLIQLKDKNDKNN